MAGEIFISYRRADQDKARLLHALLKQRGVDAWYDGLLGPGEDWRHKTAHALEAAPIFVLLFSKAASESDDISKELAAATFSKKLVIPVRLENIKPTGAFLYELASRNWIDAYENTEAKLADLADKLAALVKGGAEAEVAAFNLGAPEGAPKIGAAKRLRVGKPSALAIVGIVAAAVVAIVAIWAFSRPSASASGSGSSDQRVAFFGITAADDDPVSKAVAAGMTDNTFRRLGNQHLEPVARGEAVVGAGESRLAKAAELKARYALSGEARRDGEKVRVTMRIEDVPSRTTLSEQIFEERAATPKAASLLASQQLTTMAECISSSALTGGSPETPEALSASSAACQALFSDPRAMGVGGVPRYAVLLTDMAQKHLGGPDTDAALAFANALAATAVEPPQRDVLQKKAEEALAHATAARPESFATLTAMVQVEVGKLRPAEVLPVMEKGLQRAPGRGESFWYEGAAIYAGHQMLAVGRMDAAAAYFEAAHEMDPDNIIVMTEAALVESMRGRFYPKSEKLWDDVMVDTFRDTPASFPWEISTSAAMFFGTGDAEKLFKVAPADLPDFAAKCYRTMQAALKQTSPQARLASAKKVEVCLRETSGPQVYVQAASLLGDVDAAYAVFDEPGVMADLASGRYYAPWFTPAMKAVRADARFLPLMQKAGYVDYWKQSKTKPDVCATPEERGIPLCRALE